MERIFLRHISSDESDQRRSLNVRVFIAIPLPQRVQEAVEEILEEIKMEMKGVAWVPRENLHITLKFLGEVKDQDIDPIAAVLKREGGQFPSFPLSLKGWGAFPSNSRARILWVPVEEGMEMVGILHEKVESALGGLGYERDRRPFRGHVTVGRVRRRKGAPIIELLPGKCELFGEFEANSIHICKSTLTKKGAIYDIIEEVPLTDS